MAPDEVYRFGAFALEVHERRLAKNGHVLPISPKAFDILVVLVRKATHLVTKTELLDGVWAGSFVEEGNLSVHLAALRKLLDDDSRRPWCIETIPRIGYRFIAPVSSDTAGSGTAASGPEAYELVGRARFHLLSASRAEVPKAIAEYQAVIEREPTYAAAHAGLALGHCAEAELRLAEPSVAYNAARASALRALAMDSTCADAQLALGVVLFLADWNWTVAERSFTRALDLNPEHTEALLVYGSLLEAVGRLREGLSMKVKALERDPFSPLVHVRIALSYWHQRRYDDVIEWAGKTLALDPDHLLAREFLAGAFLKKADLDRHMSESLTHARSFGVDEVLLDAIAKAYASGGRAAVIRGVLDRATRGETTIPEMQWALMSAELGDLDTAFQHLDAALAERDPCLVHMAVAPQWDTMRADPRFSERLQKMGLPTLAASL